MQQQLEAGLWDSGSSVQRCTMYGLDTDREILQSNFFKNTQRYKCHVSFSWDVLKKS